MWVLVFRDASAFDLSKIDSSSRQRIVDRLKWFVNHFESVSPMPLGGEWHNYFKFRVGDFRIIYKIDWGNKVIFVHAVGRRDKIYKNPSRKR